MKYRKKLVVIEAFQWTGNSSEYPEWFSNGERLTEWVDTGDEKHAIPRMELKRNGYERCMQKLAMLEDIFELIESEGVVYQSYLDCPPDYKKEYCTDWNKLPNQGCEGCPHRILSILELKMNYDLIPKLGETVFLTKEEALSKKEVEE